jgi:hypothetical protein
VTKILRTILSVFIVTPFFLLDVSAQGKALVVNYTDDQLVIEYYPGKHQAQSVDIGGKQYLYYQDAEVTGRQQVGKISFPAEAFAVGIPVGGRPTLQILTEKYELSKGVRIAPAPEIIYTQDSAARVERRFKSAVSPSGAEGWLPSSVAEISKVSWFRYQRIAVIEVHPFQYDAGSNTLKTLSSLRIQIHFSLTSQEPGGRRIPDPLFESAYKSLLINYEQAKGWRGTAGATVKSRTVLPQRTVGDLAQSWFDPSKQYYKMPISQDGIYRLSFSDLQNLGISPQSLDFHRLDLYYKGIPIPFRTVGESDGQFNEGDYIEFYGSKLYDAPHVSNEFSDTSVYWMTFEGNKNQRSTLDTLVAQNPEVTTGFFEQTVRLETDTFYYYGDGGIPSNNQSDKVPGEGWYWRALYANQETSFGLTIKNVYRIGNPDFRILLRVHSPVLHQANPDHQLDVFVNETLVGRAEFNGYSDTTFSISAPSNLLVEGGNAISVHSNSTQASLNEVLIDWVELHYMHSLAADSDSFSFSSNQVPPNKVASFQLTGFSSGDITAYRLDSLGGVEKTFRGAVSQDGTQFTFTFTDTVLSAKQYLALTEGRKRVPVDVQAKTFKNIVGSIPGADYVIVTSSAFSSAATRLANYRSQQGIGRTAVVYISDIYDEFSFGLFDPMALRHFVLATDSLWPPPKPSYLVLMGDADWDYKDNSMSGVRNIVPSLGNPVSDERIVAAKDDIFLPQKYVGRIPCRSPDEASSFVDEVISYESSPLSLWNKRFMFMASGWDSLETLRLQQFSDFIISQYVQSPPIVGLPSRLYRTISQIAPFQDTEDAKRILGDGAVWINFYGHAGVDLWANGITKPDELQNGEQKRHLVSDISCSTARFAEPTQSSFGEQILLAPSASGGGIAYLGSSGYGYESPLRFLATQMYKQISQDTIREVGRAHLVAKVALWQTGTASIITQQALQEYTLLGDPATKIAIARLPDYAVQSEQVSVEPAQPTEADTSITLSFVVANYGLKADDSVKVRVTDEFQSSSKVVSEILVPPIQAVDSLSFSTSLLSHAGFHTIVIEVDPDGRLHEVSKLNNKAQTTIFVSRGQTMPISPLSSSIVHPDSAILVFQNPNLPGTSKWRAEFEVDTSTSFTSSSRIQKSDVPQGILYTQWAVPPALLGDDLLYNWRARLHSDLDSTAWTGGYFVSSKSARAQWIQDREKLFQSDVLENISVGPSLNLLKQEIPVEVFSAGFSDGATAVIHVNNINVSLGFSDRGYNIAVINQFSGKVEAYAAFSIYSDAGDTTLADPLIRFLQSIPYGRKVLIGISDEGAKGKAERLNQAIESLGSRLIRSLGFRASWAMIGWKGAPIGSVPESLSVSGAGPVTLRDTLDIASVEGSVLTNEIGPAARWKSLHVDVDTLVPGTHFSLDIIRRAVNGVQDTVKNVSLDGSSFSSVLTSNISTIQLRGILRSDNAGMSSTLRSWSVSYDPAPDLAINYQTVETAADTLQEGDPLKVKVGVYNVGFSVARRPVLSIEATSTSGTSTFKSSTALDSLSPFSSVSVETDVPTKGMRGLQLLSIQVHTDSLSSEISSLNNFFSEQIFVRKDTMPPQLQISFDGVQIVNGDYVSANPNILMKLFDNSPLAFQDTSNVSLRLDNVSIPYLNNPQLTYSFPSTGSEKAELRYEPQLTDGGHSLFIDAQDASGNLLSGSGFRVDFTVRNAPTLQDVYNYPNPFSTDTYFTFNLTGSTLPDELKIRIYTVAGRLIHTLLVPVNSLRFGFNRFYWDGRDHDGNEIANGVYFYTMVLKSGDKTFNVTERLAKVR